ncbi:MAG: glycosyltransferase [Candidatus Heimdallarchaeaceae archaeon]
MNILVVTNQFPSESFKYKGSFIYQQVKELKKHVQNISIVAPMYGKDRKYEVFDNIPIYRFKFYTKKVKDPLLRYLFSGIKGKISLVSFVLFQVLKVLQIVKKKKIDIIHAHWILPSGFSSLIVALLFRKKLVLTAHGSDLTYCSKTRILRSFLKFTIQKCQKFIGVTSYITELAMEICNQSSKFNTIHLGVANKVNELVKTESEQMEKIETIWLILVGSLYPLKGIQYLLDSILILSHKRNDFKCRIIGDGILFNKFQTFIKENNLEEYCELKGFLSHDETIKFISDSSIAIQTSLSEGLSVFLQESVFLGKPVVATDVGGTKDIVEDGVNGYLIQPEDAKELAQKINDLLNDRNKIRIMGLNSLKIAEKKLILEQNVKRIVEIYKEI